jgi:DNA-binding response OmpR family regulator
MSILLADDDLQLATFLSKSLESEGYSVRIALDEETVLSELKRQNYKLIILDLNFGQTDGLKLLERLRGGGLETPIIVLSARNRVTDRIQSLNLGADDYVTKPFSPRELVARVRAVLRRASGSAAGQEAASAPLQAGDLSIDPEKRAVVRGGQTINLTTTEFDLLYLLARTPGRVFNRMELLDRIQGAAYEGYERTIDVHIKNLRKKIEPDPRHPRYILTVYGAGYRFAEDINA